MLYSSTKQKIKQDHLSPVFISWNMGVTQNKMAEQTEYYSKLHYKTLRSSAVTTAALSARLEVTSAIFSIVNIVHVEHVDAVLTSDSCIKKV